MLSRRANVGKIDEIRKGFTVTRVNENKLCRKKDSCQSEKKNCKVTSYFTTLDYYDSWL